MPAQVMLAPAVPDRLPPDAIAEFQKLGPTRAPIQEGEQTNGLIFLAMHRVMIGLLTAQFPAHVAGWTTPPRF